MLLSARHTGIVVKNLTKSLDFYTSLGFVEQSRDTESGYFIEQVTGICGVTLHWVKLSLSDGFLLEILKYEQNKCQKLEPPEPSKLGCSHIAFTVSNAQDVCQKIESLGGKVINQPAKSPNGQVKVAYCYDTENILLEIVEVL
ncbi:VOC family protein [Catenovulum sediminis]|uniref:VOC family protein n=1 Tax=Catenovulum sediminis TaxID=1740262 RepID=A0ABV1RHG8_9ALTE